LDFGLVNFGGALRVELKVVGIGVRTT